MEKKQLIQTKQCLTCPWRKDADPFEIPDGYSVELHEELEKTIVNPDYNVADVIKTKELNCMACHYSKKGHERYCIGWLFNQLGVGNNVQLRIQMMFYSNAGDIEVIGEQHETFQDTLPKK